MIHSQIHQKQSKIHRSQRIQRNDDSESHTILNSMLLSTRKPRPIFHVQDIIFVTKARALFLHSF